VGIQVVTPKISVIVPVYNKEAYLSRTLDALLVQTFRDLEIILVDDGSRDASGRICDDYAARDSRVRAIHQTNRGVSAARNAGLDAAGGAYVAFCDADDIPGEDLYETLYDLAQTHDCDVAMVKESIRYADGSEVAEQTGELTVWEENTEALQKFLLEQISMGIYTKLIRGDIAAKVRFEEGRRINEDKGYLFDIFPHARRLCYLDVCKYAYIRNDSSCSLTPFSEKYLDMLYFADKIREICAEKMQELVPAATASAVMAYLRFLQIALLRGKPDQFPKERKETEMYLRQVSDEICKTYLPTNLYVKWRICKMGRLPFRLALKLFSREAS
jgi:glycosyltransferase involved in cell wall biosynthesis